MRVLGDSWNRLAEPVRCVHDTHPIVRAHGRLRIQHGRHSFARFLARLLRLPPPGTSVPTQLIVTARADGERWHRTFNGRRLDTRQCESSGTGLVERFGVLEFRFRLDASDGSLVYVQREAALRAGPLRLLIPTSWAPRIEAREDPAGPNRVKVDVRIDLPRLGPLITYDGVIDVVETQ
jgi:hypothetical protein